MAIGKYIKPYLFKFKLFIVSIISLVVIFTMYNLHIFNYLNAYGLELYARYYRYPILDFIVPCSFFFVLSYVSKVMEKYRAFAVLENIGKFTLPIMAIHDLFINLQYKYGIRSKTIIFFVCVLVPYLIGRFVFNRIKLLKKYLL